MGDGPAAAGAGMSWCRVVRRRRWRWPAEPVGAAGRALLSSFSVSIVVLVLIADIGAGLGADGILTECRAGRPTSVSVVVSGSDEANQVGVLVGIAASFQIGSLPPGAAGATELAAGPLARRGRENRGRDRAGTVSQPRKTIVRLSPSALSAWPMSCSGAWRPVEITAAGMRSPPSTNRLSSC